MKIQSRRRGRIGLVAFLPVMLSVAGLTTAAYATCLEDSDNDSVPDPYDNCLSQPNDQADADGDGFGNACDSDFNQDGTVTIGDFNSFLGVFGSEDAEHDLDGDGFVSLADFVIFINYFGSTPGPSGLSCADSTSGGSPACEISSYEEIASTTTTSVVLRPQRSVPIEDELRSDSELFVFPSAGREVLASDYTLGYSSDGSYDPTSALTLTTVASGSVVTRWVMHAQSVGGSAMAFPVGTGVTFDVSEEILGVDVIGDPGSLLDFDGSDIFEIDGQTVAVTVPTEGIQLEILTACAPLRGVTISLDRASALIGAPASFPFGAAIEAGDLLTVGDPGSPGPNPPQSVTPISSPGEMVDQLALIMASAASVEVDAVSYGRERGPILRFSVDEFAVGVPTVLNPSVFSEGATGSGEAAADIFEWAGALPGTIGGAAGNVGLFDGDGYVPFGGDGFGLVEPYFPLPGAPYVGDDIDAFDGDTRATDLGGNIFFSLDAASAASMGFSGADVLISDGINQVGAYLSWFDLGLDAAGDDIDALALRETDTSTPAFDPTVDRIHFSLRKGSSTLGTPDSRFGLPIEPGDVLTFPRVPGGPPAIGVRAEDLGLRTVRSGAPESDELNALDRVRKPGGSGDENPGGDPIGNPN